MGISDKAILNVLNMLVIMNDMLNSNLSCSTISSHVGKDELQIMYRLGLIENYGTCLIVQKI
jgi:hypothetical protein